MNRFKEGETDPGFLRINFTKSPEDVSEAVRRLANYFHEDDK